MRQLKAGINIILMLCFHDSIYRNKDGKLDRSEFRHLVNYVMNNLALSRSTGDSREVLDKFQVELVLYM